jgi:hypothetical protein
VGFCRRCSAPDFETLESYAHIRTQTLQDLGNRAAHSWAERPQKSQNTHDLQGAGYQQSAAGPLRRHGPSGDGTFGPMTAKARARNTVRRKCRTCVGPTPPQSLINIWRTQTGPRRSHQPPPPSTLVSQPTTQQFRAYTQPGNTPPPRSPQWRKPSDRNSPRFVKSRMRVAMSTSQDRSAARSAQLAVRGGRPCHVSASALAYQRRSAGAKSALPPAADADRRQCRPTAKATKRSGRQTRGTEGQVEPRGRHTPAPNTKRNHKTAEHSRTQHQGGPRDRRTLPHPTPRRAARPADAGRSAER